MFEDGEEEPVFLTNGKQTSEVLVLNSADATKVVVYGKNLSEPSRLPSQM